MDVAVAQVSLAGGGGGGAALVQPTVRSKFADTAYCAAALTTDKARIAETDLTMPEILTP